MEMRVLSVARDSDTVRAEVVFSKYDQVESTAYFQTSALLPIMKNGRRKLFMTFTEAGTNSVLRIPPNVAMAFREKHLVRIEVLHRKAKSK